MLRRYSPSATEPAPNDPRSIASISDCWQPSFTRARTRYRILNVAVPNPQKRTEIIGCVPRLTLRFNDFPIGILTNDFAISEFQQVTTTNMDLLSISRRAR